MEEDYSRNRLAVYSAFFCKAYSWGTDSTSADTDILRHVPSSDEYRLVSEGLSQFLSARTQTREIYQINEIRRTSIYNAPCVLQRDYAKGLMCDSQLP